MNQSQGYEYLSGIVTMLNRMFYFYGEFKIIGYHVNNNHLIVTLEILNNENLSEMTISLPLDN